jgi:hypothetical protein
MRPAVTDTRAPLRRAARDEVTNPRRAGASAPVGRVRASGHDSPVEETPRSPPGKTPERRSGVGATRSSGESAGEEGPGGPAVVRPQGRAMVGRSGPLAEAGRALEGRTPGGHRPRAIFGRPPHGLSGEKKALKTALPGVSQAPPEANGRRAGGLRERPGPPARSKALKAKPQERYRDETSPGGVAG